MKLADEGKRDIEAVFGEGRVTTFVWPYREPHIDELEDYIINGAGYKAVRKTGTLKDSTGFAMPFDRGHWTYNATDSVLEETAKLYENYPDDGNLKFFSFGLHYHDYERAGTWNVLENFVCKYGNRPEDYYYASVEEIFDYEDAINSLVETEDYIENPTDIKVYIKVDDRRIVLEPGSKFSYKNRISSKEN